MLEEFGVLADHIASTIDLEAGLKEITDAVPDIP